MPRAKLLVLALLAVMTAACSTTPVAVVPTPWAVVGVGQFGANATEQQAPSAMALAIEAERHNGLASGSEAAKAPVVAVR